MRFGRRHSAVILSLAAAGFTSANPAEGLTLTANTRGEVLGTVHADSQGPASSGTVLSIVNFPVGYQITFTDTATAQAAMNDSGVGAVLADAALLDNGSGHLLAEATWSETVTNTFSVGFEYIYHFTITPPRLTIVDATDGSMGAPSGAEYVIEVKLNNRTIFQSHAVLRGKTGSQTLQEDGTDLGGTFFSNPVDHTFGYAFSPFTGNESLGFYFPGQGFTITTRLAVFTDDVANGRGARAEIGDPLDLGGEPGIKNSFILASPLGVEPATWSAVKELYH